ncbi:MAG: NapC/NirT family cytochrome c [Thermoleophilia bacterium]|nr:NapC/NirT family cytochrome c [Thermoleophilia bacterium]
MGRLPLIAGIVLVITGVLTAVGFDYTSKPGFCSSCHTIAPYAQAWETSSHKDAGVTCIDCHFEPGAVGYLKGKIYSLIKLTQWAVGETDRKPEAARTIVGGACRQCHPDAVATFIPHSYHTEIANLQCTECHSAIAHGTELIADKPQAAADPAFCGRCHTGDIAPVLFGPIEPAGREHPGAPKIDVDVWRNIHWRMADAPAVIDGKPYDKIEKDTCLACHQEPTVAKACKGCHFARVPEFRLSTAAEEASGLPLGIAGVMFLLLMLTVFLKSKEKAAVFSSRFMQALVALIALSDVVVVYLIVRDTLVKETGSVEIGPTTVWITYLLLSIAIVLLVLYESIIRPGHERLVLLPQTDEEEIYVPDHNVWLKQPEASTFLEGDEPDPLYRYAPAPTPEPQEDEHA